MIDGSNAPKREKPSAKVIDPMLFTSRVRALFNVYGELKNDNATVSPIRSYLMRKTTRVTISLMHAYTAVEVQDFWDFAQDDPKRFEKDYNLAANSF